MNLNTDYFQTIREFAETMSQKGIASERGIETSEFEALNKTFGFVFPPDLKFFLSIAMPISSGFPNWRRFISHPYEFDLHRCYKDLTLSVQEDNFWLDSWGKNNKSGFSKSSLDVVYGNVPNMIPIFEHRYMPDTPKGIRNPVFSSLGSDTIVYGNDLVDYFIHEFKFRPTSVENPMFQSTPILIPLWSEICDKNDF